MENGFSLVYQTSEDLVKVLKKTLKPYKSVIKDNTNRKQRFAFVSLKRIHKLDNCVRDLKSNNFEFNHSIDRKINQICRKYDETDASFEEQLDYAEEQPPKKKKKIVDSLLDLNLINDENEDLDFEEENNKSIETNGEKYTILNSEPKTTTNDNNSHKMNGFAQKTNQKKTNGSVYNSAKNGIKPEMNRFSVFNNNINTNNSFKIPKMSSQSIENIISHAESLARSTKRPFEAYNYLSRYLTEEQWRGSDIMELLLTIAKNMVTTYDFSANVTKFNELIDKIKSLQYIDDDFWDQIIYSVDKKKSDSKNIHQINTFLSNLHNYMMDNKICARVVCNDAVIIAYRIVTNHSSAKDLIDLQI